jgi:ABC-type multidrug transport system fused ATPase/permease subunit
MKSRTVIAVVERIDLARYYERVIVLEGGKVADGGSYDELIAKEGLFRDLAVQAGIAR